MTALPLPGAPVRRIRCWLHSRNGLSAPADGPDGLCARCRSGNASRARIRPLGAPDPAVAAEQLAAVRKGTRAWIAAAQAANLAAAELKRAEYRRLRDVEGLTLKAAAERLGIDPKTARRRYEDPVPRCPACDRLETSPVHRVKCGEIAARGETA